MNEQQLVATVNVLSETLKHTRAELDAMRTIFIGVLRGLADDPVNGLRMATAVAAAIEGDQAFSLNSQMPDEMLELRAQWLQRLLPTDWKP